VFGGSDCKPRRREVWDAPIGSDQWQPSNSRQSRSVVYECGRDWKVTRVAHPFATAGGGTLFEYKVATLLAADLIRSRLTEHHGVVAALEMQTGPSGFDDLQISLELQGEGHRTVHAQCRHRQPFTAANAKFATLLAQAETAVDSDGPSFASGERRLSVIVDRSSPGHASMTSLCDLARAPGDISRFVRTVEAHAGRIADRWGQTLGAANTTKPAALRRCLAALEVRAVDLRTVASGDSLEFINRLAGAWDPLNHEGALNLANALFKHLTDIGPDAGAIDLRSLRTRLGAFLPTTLGATTRRARLGRLRDAAHQRVAMALRAIGLGDVEAEALASRALAIPPTVSPPVGLTIVTGAMGVGKTTELERLHRQAIDRAIEDTNAPIPILVHAGEVGGGSLQSVAGQRAKGLGDPSRTGAHLIVDGLDEAGIRIGQLTARVATLQAVWPGSTVIIASRPESPQPKLQTEVVGPLSETAAAELMAIIRPDGGRWVPLRPELSEVLRRPLFAIRYALDQREGNPSGIHEAQLVDSVGRQAVGDLVDMTDGMFEFLVQLACSVVDSGGQPVDVRSLEATPVQIAQLSRSRIVHVIDGRATFQLAVLTEWLAAHALLHQHGLLERSVASPLRAHRWRYALVQALLQGSAGEVDAVMSTLLTHAPATAAWAHHQAHVPYWQERIGPPAATAIEAGARVRRAAGAWIGPWPGLIKQVTVNGEMPTLGVAMNGPYLVTAWNRSQGNALGPAVPLPAHVHPLRTGDEAWTGSMAGRPSSTEMWPWDWTRDLFQRQVDDWLENRDLLAEIDICWPELAWDYAHRILKRSAVVQSKPVQRSEVEAAIAKVRDHLPDGEAWVSEGGFSRYGWWLTEAETFVADLSRLNIDEVGSPWPPANSMGPGWTGHWWTTEQLHARLQLATKAGLDVYRAVVERHLPAMARELDTYQLLPARIVGLVNPGDPSEGYEGQESYSWYLEPLPAGSTNEAHWQVGESQRWADDSGWETRIATIRALRGDVAEHAQLTTHHGAPQILSSTPAGSLALALLARDLAGFNWTSKSSRFDSNSGSTRPRYT
jgi:hypothetical protein